MPPIALTLGNIQLGEFEVPDTIDHFCGTQKMVRHDFPGGIIAVQTFGAFPPRNIRWTGAFIEGDFQAAGQSAGPGVSAQDRIDDLNQLRAAGTPVLLTFLTYQYNVVIHDFQVHPRMQWWMPYTIDLVPLQDLTPSSQPPLPTPSSLPDSGSTDPFGDLQVANQDFGSLLGSPLAQQAGGNSPAQVANSPQTLAGSVSSVSTSNLKNLVAGAIRLLQAQKNTPTNLAGTLNMLAQSRTLLSSNLVTGNTLLAVGGLIAQVQTILSVVAPSTPLSRALTSTANRIQSDIHKLGVNATGTSTLTAFQESLVKSLQAALGNVNNVDNANLDSQLAAAKTVSQQLINSGDPAAAAFGTQATAQLLNIQQKVQAVPQTITTIHAVNPNLQRLARTYYKNPHKWTVIAQANGLQKVQNKGSFTLIIPRIT